MFKFKNMLQLKKDDVYGLTKNKSYIFENGTIKIECNPISFKNEFCQLFKSTTTNEYIVYFSYDPWCSIYQYNYAIIEVDNIAEFDLNKMIKDLEGVSSNLNLRLNFLSDQIKFVVSHFKNSNIEKDSSKNYSSPNSSVFRSIELGNLELVEKYNYYSSGSLNSSYLAIALKIGSNIEKNNKILIASIILLLIYIHCGSLHRCSHVNSTTGTAFSIVGVEISRC